MPVNPLQLELCIETTSLLPRRILEFAFTSLTASSIAILATLPMVVSNEKMAPILTTAGLEVKFLLWMLENSPQTAKKNERSTIAFILNQKHITPRASQMNLLTAAAREFAVN